MQSSPRDKSQFDYARLAGFIYLFNYPRHASAGYGAAAVASA